jgi:hypothetical protein
MRLINPHGLCAGYRPTADEVEQPAQSMCCLLPHNVAAALQFFNSRLPAALWPGDVCIISALIPLEPAQPRG